MPKKASVNMHIRTIGFIIIVTYKIFFCNRITSMMGSNVKKYTYE